MGTRGSNTGTESELAASTLAWWMDAVRTLNGLALAPFVGGGMGLGSYMLVFELIMKDIRAGDLWDLFSHLFQAIPAGAMTGFVMGVPTTLLIGWPLYRFVMRGRWKGHIPYLFLFAGLAILSPYVFLLLSGQIQMAHGLIEEGPGPGIPLLLAWSGAIGGEVFWWIRRPDRIPKRVS